MHKISKTSTAALLLDPAKASYLERLMQREWSIAALSADLAHDLSSVHYHVGQLVKHDLVSVIRTEKRAGRSVKHYRASAPSFFVPFTLTDFETLHAFWRAILEPSHSAFVARLVRVAERRATNPADWGLVIECDVEAGFHLRSEPRPTFAPSDPVSWLSEDDLKLTHAQARALQLELRAVIAKYQRLSGPHGYTVRAGLVAD